jgi:hypothetical protein
MHRTALLAIALSGVIALSPALAGAHSAPVRPTAVTTTRQASLLAVPKFIFHAGLAFGAFHHFIYTPFKAGKFTTGSFFSKLKAYVEAGLAGLFVYHETKLALADAQQNKALKLLVTPLTAAVALFDTIVSKIKGHSLDAATMTSAESSVSSIETMAAASGSTVSEAIPTAAQLAAGSA